MKIGDLLWRLGVAQDGNLQAEVIKEADKAGKAGAQSLSQRLKTGLMTEGVRAFGLVASGAFALATKGALELENVQIDLQRETGLTADAARDAAKAINGIAGRNVTDLRSVSDAFAKVHNDLGLAGDAAIEATEAFVKFGRATNQEAAGAVSDFDDILDAWGLEATDATRIMDKLVVSHQKYGGSVEANQKALATLAPQLQALGADVDDGVALLNLFAASGIDASKATTALNTAVKNLKPGQSIDDLVKQVSSIEDPTLRAQKAIELFGARGGVALANALRPGVDSLDDFGISATEAAGATEKASDAIDSSFSGRIRKAISEASTALRGFGADFGPALTGLASLASLAGSVFPGVGKAVGEGILGGLKGIGKRLGVKVAEEAATSAAGETVGKVIAGNIGDGLAKSGALGDAVAQGLDDAPRSSKLAGSISKLRSFLTTKLGAGLVLGVTVTVAKVVTDKLAEFQNDQVKDLVAKGNLEGLKNFLQAAKLQLAAQSSGPQGLIAEFTGLNDGLKQNIQEATDAIAQLEAQGTAALQSAGEEMRTEAYKAGATVPDGVAAGIKDYAPTVRDRATDYLGSALDKTTFRDRLYAKGSEAVLAFAQGITDARQKPVDAFEQLKEALKHPLTRTQEAARLAGQLASKELAQGLKSGDSAIRAQAEGTRQLILERLKQLQGEGGTRGLGKKAMDELKRAMKSKDPAVRQAAYEIYKTAKTQLDKMKPAATQAGSQAGKNAAAALRGQQGPLYNAAYALARKVGLSILAGIRAGAGIGGRGGAVSDPDIHRAQGGPVEAFKAYTVGERGPETLVIPKDGYVLPNDWMSKLAVPKARGWDGAAAPPAAASGTTVVNYNIPLTGIVEARSAEDIVRPLRQLAATGTFERDKRLVRAAPRPIRG